MKQLLLLALLMVGTSVYSQQHPTGFTQCQLTVDEILGQQSFDIDEPISEDARYIFFDIYANLNAIYIAESQNNTTNLSELIAAFETSIEDATNLQLNFSMFQDDITFVESITP